MVHWKLLHAGFVAGILWARGAKHFGKFLLLKLVILSKVL